MQLKNANIHFSIFILSLICLLKFISVVGYLTSIYLVNKYDVETKYPKFKRIIRYYEKSSLFFVVLEGVMCVVFLLLIIVSSLYFAGVPIFKKKYKKKKIFFNIFFFLFSMRTR